MSDILRATMKKLLPIIFVVLALIGGLTYVIAKKSLETKRQALRFGIAANQLESDVTPTPKANAQAFVFLTPSPTVVKVTPTVTPISTVSAVAKVTPKVTKVIANTASTSKGGIAIAKTTTNKSVICTPVYGMANTCVEHVVVDTGIEDHIFFNLAGVTYLAGLVAFIKAKVNKA